MFNPAGRRRYQPLKPVLQRLRTRLSTKPVGSAYSIRPQPDAIPLRRYFAESSGLSGAYFSQSGSHIQSAA
jgi:hypothetical protein